MELKCAVQYYDWGKPGETSEVALLANANSEVPVENSKTYAELWMGTHPSGPSVIKGSEKSLKSHIEENPDILGAPNRIFPPKSLPFLLKVLSVNKPLSIQAHPTKKHAEELNASQPDIYKDDNHKPEMAIALTPFEALCGFRPAEEIKKFFKIIPELESVIGVEQMSNFMNELSPETLKECFNNLMTADPQLIKTTLQNLLKRLYSCDEKTRTEQCATLVERLHKCFPGDVGVFGVYFFNYIQLKQGEAIFLPANEPHAYISGDCVECMACSDNVVRAGLTPKLKDVTTLIEMLTYDCAPSETKKFEPILEDDCTLLFTPPVPDFALAKVTVIAGEEYELKPRDSASILIVIRGSAECSKVNLKRGSVIFLAAKEKLQMKANQQLILYQAFTGIKKDCKGSENSVSAVKVTKDSIVAKEKSDIEKIVNGKDKKNPKKNNVQITSTNKMIAAPVGSSPAGNTVGQPTLGGQTLESIIADRKRLKRKRQKERRKQNRIAGLQGAGVVINMSTAVNKAPTAVSKLSTAASNPQTAVNNPSTAVSNPPTAKSNVPKAPINEPPKKKPKPQLNATQVAGRGCIIRIFVANNGNFKSDEFNHVVEFIDNALLNNKNSPGKKKFRIRQVPNSIRIFCENNSSMEWMKRVLQDLPKPNPEHPGYSIITSKDQRMNYSSYYAWFKKKYHTQYLLSTLQSCNKGLVAAKMYVQNVFRKRLGFMYLLQVHKSLNPLLKKLNFKLRFGLTTVKLVSYMQVKNENQQQFTVFKSIHPRLGNPNSWIEPGRTIRNVHPFERVFRKEGNEPRPLIAYRGPFREENSNPSGYRGNTRRQDLLERRFSRRMSGDRLKNIGIIQNFRLRNSNMAPLNEQVNPDEDDLRNVLNRYRFGKSDTSRFNNESYRFISEGDERQHSVWQADRFNVEQNDLDPLKRIVVNNYHHQTLIRSPERDRNMSSYSEPRDTFQSPAPLESKWKNEDWNYRQPSDNWDERRGPWERGNGHHEQEYSRREPSANNPGSSFQRKPGLPYTKPLSQPLSMRERLNMSDQNNINWDIRKRMRSPEPYIPKLNRGNSPTNFGKRLKYSEPHNSKFNRQDWNSDRSVDWGNNDNKDWSNQGRTFNDNNFNRTNPQFGIADKPTNMIYNNDFSKFDYKHRTNPDVFPESSVQFDGSSRQPWINNEPKTYRYNQINRNESVRELGSNMQLTFFNERYSNEKAMAPSLSPSRMIGPSMGSRVWSPPLRRPGSPPLRRPGSPPLRRPGSPPLRRPGSPPLRLPGSPPLRRPGSPSLRRPGFAPLRLPRSPPLRLPRSPPLRRPGSPSLQRLPPRQFENRQNYYGPNNWQRNDY